jgi:hypothetical protein
MAEVLEIGQTTRLRNLVFKLPPALQIREVRSRPKLPSQFKSSTLQVTLHEAEHSSPTDHGKLSKDGTYVTKGFEGRTYWLRGFIFDGNAFDVIVAAGFSNAFQLNKDLDVIEWELTITPAGWNILERYTWFDVNSCPVSNLNQIMIFDHRSFSTGASFLCRMSEAARSAEMVR